MRHARQRLLLLPAAALAAVLTLVLCAGALSVGGCAAGPHTHADGSAVSPAEDALINANDLIAASYREIAAARDAGLIKQSQIDRYRSLRVSIDAALDEGRRQLEAGNLSAVEIAVGQARAALANLGPLLDLIRQQKGGK